MTFQEFINSMTEAEQDAYAVRCGTTGHNLRAHVKWARKVSRRDRIYAYSENSNGCVSHRAVLLHFYPERLGHDDAA